MGVYTEHEVRRINRQLWEGIISPVLSEKFSRNPLGWTKEGRIREDVDDSCIHSKLCIKQQKEILSGVKDW
ncbi:hypothetical protein D3C80_2040060 [compost metagenome]